jgi:hypothetical protein
MRAEPGAAADPRGHEAVPWLIGSPAPATGELVVRRQEGFRVAEAHDVFRQTIAATGDRIAALKAVRVRFGLDLRQAKEVMLQAEGTAASVDEHEERIAIALEQALAEQRHAELDVAPDRRPASS